MTIGSNIVKWLSTVRHAPNNFTKISLPFPRSVHQFEVVGGLTGDEVITVVLASKGSSKRSKGAPIATAKCMHCADAARMSTNRH